MKKKITRKILDFIKNYETKKRLREQLMYSNNRINNLEKCLDDYDETHYETLNLKVEKIIYTEELKLPGYEEHLEKCMIHDLGESIAKELISRRKLERINHGKDLFRDAEIIQYRVEIKFKKSSNTYINPFVPFD
ncbi:hypothetical protein [Ruminococcus sp.]|uniref:hypothetical protein n=1 Tax=Ruminococcus sp. TaxID=41978 RepID=UPI003F02F5BA